MMPQDPSHLLVPSLCTLTKKGILSLFRLRAEFIHTVADLHYSVGSGSCRDSDKEPCVGDPDTATWLADALDAEQPDLVVSLVFPVINSLKLPIQVFSGDQLNGQETSFDSRSVLAKFAKPVIEREISWCAVFGETSALHIWSIVLTLDRR